MKNKFTKKEINNYKSYEIIRKSGAYNMYDYRARLATGLSPVDYRFVMENYIDLKDAADNFNADEYLLKQTDHS